MKKIFLVLFLLAYPSISTALEPCEREINKLAVEAYLVQTRVTRDDNDGSKIYMYTHDRHSVDLLTRWIRVCADIQNIRQIRAWERDSDGYVSAIFDCSDSNYVFAVVGSPKIVSMSPLKVK